MQDKEEERTLLSVEKHLNELGYTQDFAVADGRLHTLSNASAKTYAPDEITITDFYRFEGDSNPDDMSILYALTASDGTKGTISSAYGPYADTDIDDFLKNVEDLGKNLVKDKK